MHKVSSPATATPATDGQTVVVQFGSYGLVAYDFDGNLHWKRPLPLAKVTQDFGSGGSPIIVDDKVVAWVPRENESYLGAYRLDDGSEIWQVPRGQFNHTWATPIQWEVDGRRQVGMLTSGRFSAFDAADGRELWWTSQVAVNSGSNPIALGSEILICSAGVQGDAENIVVPEEFDTLLEKVDANGDGKIGLQEIPDDVLFTTRFATDGAGDLSLKEAFGFMGLQPDHLFEREAWETAREQMVQFKNGPMSRTSAAVVRTGGTGDVTESNRVWEQPRGVGEVPSPLVYRDFIYLIRNGGVLTVRSLATGEQTDSKRIRGAAGGYYATPVAADGRIYLANDAGIITVMEAGPKLELLSQCDAQEPIFAMPAIVEDVLYVRTTEHLYAFGPK